MMDEKEATALKNWVVKRLEGISDADPDVLADYVLALVRSEDKEEIVKANCVEQLKDFLHDDVGQFVEDVFRRFKGNTDNAGARNTAQSLPGLSGSAGGKQENGSISSAELQSKKRSYHDRNNAEADSARQNGSPKAERPFKQMRRSSHAARGGKHSVDVATPTSGIPNNPGMPFMPNLLSGVPNFDPNNPMAAMMAMQAIGFPLPGFPPFETPASPTNHPSVSSQWQVPVNKIRQRCADYDTKGYCAAGTLCPYEHGEDHIVIPSETDTLGSSNLPTPAVPGHVSSTSSDRRGSSHAPVSGRARGGSHRGRSQHPGNRRDQRASFSSAGPNYDRTNTSIVVEQIPEEKFNEESVRDFFSEFGKVEDVNMQAYKRLAIVRFEDWTSANKAYNSPKVIFENRFVKVYWYKPNPTNGSTAIKPGAPRAQPESPAEAQVEEEVKIDPEEFKKRQDEAQRQYEEKTKKVREAEAARTELEKRMKEQAEERQRLMEKLAKKTGKGGSPAPLSTRPAPNVDVNGQANANNPVTKGSTQTEALQAKLAELEKEAETLGLSTDDPAPASHGHHPYWQGSQRGARGRGRGGETFPRGRGIRGALRGGAVARLDNRPRNVEITAQDSEVDFAQGPSQEAIKTHLFNIGQFDSIVPSELKSQAAIVKFTERWTAEEFVKSLSAVVGGPSIPNIGKIEWRWIPNTTVTNSAAQPEITEGTTEKGNHLNQTEANQAPMRDHESENVREAGREKDMDWDVAEDDGW